MANKIYKVEKGYDLVSNDFDKNKWNHFWKINEAPYVDNWLKTIKKGFGLDAGAGTGIYLNSIVEYGHDCIELDISRQMLNVNQKKHLNIESKRAIYLKLRIDKKLFVENFFDWILCTRVLSHCRNLEKQIATFSHYLKSGSECFISDIHPDHNYYQTGFRLENDKKVYIETFKHTIEEYKNAAINSGFNILKLQEFSMKNLKEYPDSEKFSKLYIDKNKKIFFIMVLKKK